MKRKSIIILLLGAFWLGYTILTIGTYVYENGKFYQAEVDRRKGLIDFHLDNGIHYLMNQKINSLLPRLHMGRELREYDFFILKEKDKVHGFYNKDNYLEGINHNYQIIDQFQESDEFALKTAQIQDYKLTLGINKNKNAFLWDLFRDRKSVIAQDLFLVTLLLSIIAYLVLKDIIDISKALQTNTRFRGKTLRTRSSEAETLLQASLGFETSNSDLKAANLLLSGSLGPAIQHELRSGKTAPYLIPCTLVRIDLNGYTQLFLEKDSHSLLQMLNQYFKESRQIIERYGGLIYQYIGDEIIFIIKSTTTSEISTQKALNTIRSIFDSAKKISSAEVPKGLRLKASLVTGELHFIPLDEGHAFSGLPLIESVRMLGQVTEKTESRLIIYSESLPAVQELCHASQLRTTVFKGFNRESEVIEVEDFISISEAFKKFPLKSISDYYRNDDDLVFIIEELRKYIQSENLDQFMELASPFMNFSVTDASLPLRSAFKNMLKDCLQQKMAQQSESRFLAMVISLSEHLLGSGQKDSELEAYLDECGVAQDPRVAANTIMAKFHLDLDINKEIQKHSPQSNRLSANILLYQGKTGLTPTVAKKIKTFLSSSEPKYIASGLFLVASLYDHYRQLDLVYLKSNPHFKNLAEMVPQFLQHPDPMVRDRAAISQKIINPGAA
ncbi:MAG: hypothetical protein V4736_10600 [Bdellovibrionota bacterium]